MASFPARLLLLVASAFWALALFSPDGAAAATSHIVGGDVGWGIPSGPDFYATWASDKTFAVGDSLVFNFMTGGHNVQRVSSVTPDSCGTAASLGSPIATGPATIKLSEPGAHYFICAFTGHCDAGQILAINVTGKSTASPAVAPSSSSIPESPAPVPIGSPMAMPMAPPSPPGDVSSPPPPANSSSPGTPSDASSMPATPKSGSPGNRGPLALTVLVAWLAAAYALVLA